MRFNWIGVVGIGGRVGKFWLTVPRSHDAFVLAEGEVPDWICVRLQEEKGSWGWSSVG